MYKTVNDEPRWRRMQAITSIHLQPKPVRDLSEPRVSTIGCGVPFGTKIAPQPVAS